MPRNPSAPFPALCSPEVWSTWREERAGKREETAGSQPAEDGADGAGRSQVLVAAPQHEQDPK